MPCDHDVNKIIEKRIMDNITRLVDVIETSAILIEFLEGAAILIFVLRNVTAIFSHIIQNYKSDYLPTKMLALCVVPVRGEKGAYAPFIRHQLVYFVRGSNASLD